MMGKEKGSIGWWDRSVYPNHIYKRRTRKDVTHYCGRPILERLSQKAMAHKNGLVIGGAISCAFVTGGRAMEYLMSLTESQVEERKEHIEINGMKVLKQYTRLKISTPVEDMYYEQPSHDYISTVEYRQVPIQYDEPLARIFMEFVQKVRDGHKDLPSRYFEKEYEGLLFPYKYGWFYKWLIKTDSDWFPHRFRAERASHLASRYGFGVSRLMKWFGWKSMEVALEYVALDTSDLVRQMARGEM